MNSITNSTCNINFFMSLLETILNKTGDSGYPLRPWLLTPIAEPITEAEKYYNIKHESIRSLIERCNGVLKIRFRLIK